MTALEKSSGASLRSIFKNHVGWGTLVGQTPDLCHKPCPQYSVENSAIEIYQDASTYFYLQGHQISILLCKQEASSICQERLASLKRKITG